MTIGYFALNSVFTPVWLTERVWLRKIIAWKLIKIDTYCRRRKSLAETLVSSTLFLVKVEYLNDRKALTAVLGIFLFTCAESALFVGRTSGPKFIVTIVLSDMISYKNADFFNNLTTFKFIFGHMFTAAISLLCMCINGPFLCFWLQFWQRLWIQRRWSPIRVNISTIIGHL